MLNRVFKMAYHLVPIVIVEAILIFRDFITVGKVQFSFYFLPFALAVGILIGYMIDKKNYIFTIVFSMGIVYGILKSTGSTYGININEVDVIEIGEVIMLYTYFMISTLIGLLTEIGFKIIISKHELKTKVIALGSFLFLIYKVAEYTGDEIYILVAGIIK